MSNRKGFTLIELLIVVVIIGILAAIAIPKFANTKDKAKIASMKTDLRNFVSAQEGHFADFATYATAHNVANACVPVAADGVFRPDPGQLCADDCCRRAGRWLLGDHHERQLEHRQDLRRVRWQRGPAERCSRTGRRPGLLVSLSVA